MKCNVINVMLGLFVCVLISITGCGSGGSAGPPVSNANSLITNVGWIFENAAPDYTSSGSTCLLSVNVYYSESIVAADIDSFDVSAPNGWHWSIPSSSSRFGTGSNGKPYIGCGFHYGANPSAMPLAGTWTFQLKLKNGQTSSFKRTLHEPGSSVDATHQYLYSKEDWTPSTDPSQYITALGRFPAQGYTLQYSAINGGKITTTGLSAVRTNFLAVEPRAYNMVCWLYDANKGYLGYTTPEFSPLDHSSTDLITSNGELSITPATTTSSSGVVDLSLVKYIRFVYFDGAQYVPSSYSDADYSSISSLVAVNGTTADIVVIADSFQSQLAKYTMSVPMVVKQGDVMPITFTVTNTSSSAIDVVALPIRIYLNNVEIYFSTVGTYSGGVSVQPGESKTIMTSWNNKDNNGNIVQAGSYVLIGSCLGNRENTDLRVDFTIQ